VVEPGIVKDTPIARIALALSSSSVRIARQWSQLESKDNVTLGT
jgi:hypothetical protein